MALVIPVKGAIFMVVPRLEQDAARAQSMINEVFSYFEYPGKKPPITLLTETLQKKKLTKRLLADGEGYPSYWGYEGPRLLELLSNTELKITKFVQELWRHKSAEEIEIIKETAVWGNLAHAKLQEFTKIGESEISIALRASTDASSEMLKALGPEFAGFIRGGWPTHAGFISGPNSALPHSMSWNRSIKKGDVLVTGATGHIDGYASELERTMIVGQPTAEQQKYFEIMFEAQTMGIETSGPGISLAEVDRAVWGVFEKHKITQYAQHHTGHHLGYEAHEAPFIDRDSLGQMEPGQVYSIEPGIYIPGVAGYRHSDTILITADGVEMITYYPRDIEKLIIDA
jgi:Xaa-Pro aminopeptidase